MGLDFSRLSAKLGSLECLLVSVCSMSEDEFWNLPVIFVAGKPA